MQTKRATIGLLSSSELVVGGTWVNILVAILHALLLPLNRQGYKELLHHLKGGESLSIHRDSSTYNYFIISIVNIQDV